MFVAGEWKAKERDWSFVVQRKEPNTTKVMEAILSASHTTQHVTLYT